MKITGPVPEIKTTAADDGAKLRYREWAPGAARGTVVCLHGIRSHSAWYTDSCAYLCERGYRVLFPDRRGSGINTGIGSRKPRAGRWIADAEHFVNIAARESEGKPVHLLGISWGGRIASVLGSRPETPLRSVVFSTPGIASLRGYPLFKKALVVLSLFIKSKREFAIPLQDPALFTDDPDEREYIDEDPVGLRRARARFLAESDKLERRGKRCFTKISKPLLLLLAGRDEIVDNAEMQKMFAACQNRDKEIKIYPGARHTLEFDSCKRDYFNDLAAWFDRHA